MINTEQSRSSDHQDDHDLDDLRRSNSRGDPHSDIYLLPSLLTAVDQAMLALAKANTPKELVDLANRAEAMRKYAELSRFGMQAQNRCADVRLRAERKVGVLLATMLRLHGRPKSVPDGNTLPSLSDLGIKDRKLSHRAQRLAAIPSSVFEGYLRTAHERQWEITTRILLNHCERQQAVAKNRQRVVGGRVDDLNEFAHTGPKMGCIVIDPPWPILGSTLPYETIDLEELRQLPIPDLAADRCHVHLWCLPNRSHILACNIIEHWRFRPVSEFVWVKRAIGKGNYWRMSHEILITAVRTENDRFDDRGLRSWIEAPRGHHSEKPNVVRALIERASPGPRLEIFGRKLAPGWFAWGHEIEISLAEQRP